MPIFRRFTPTKENLHGYTRGSRNKYQVWMMVMMMTMMKQGASLSCLGDVGSVALWMADQNRSTDAIEKN